MQTYSDKHPIVTEDGTVTLYSAEYGQAYHSTQDGALTESLAKHVIPALHLQQGKAHVNILDINYGLGYNTLATLYYIRKHNLDVTVHILSPELDEALVRSLKAFDYPSEFDEMKAVIEAISYNLHYEDEQFTIEVMIGDARKTIKKLLTPHSSLLTDNIETRFDIVYQDAFSPKANPLLWTREWFADLGALCADDAILTTYSVAAATRMGLHENGCELYTYRSEKTRRSLIASPSPIEGAQLEGLEWIDMAQKIARNPEGRSLRDRQILQSTEKPITS